MSAILPTSPSIMPANVITLSFFNPIDALKESESIILITTNDIKKYIGA